MTEAVEYWKIGKVPATIGLQEPNGYKSGYIRKELIMGKGYSTYNITVNAPENQIHMVIQSFLQANKFEPKPEYGVNYFLYHDPWVVGYRGFQYQVNGNMVTISVHINKPKHPQNLEGASGWAVKDGYQNLLQTLFQQLSNMNMVAANQAYMQAQAATTDPAQQAYNQAVYAQQAQAIQQGAMQAFDEQKEKRYAGFALASFIVSILMIFISFFGYMAGGVIIAFNYYMAIQGTKSKRKGLAIAALVLSTAAIAILIVEIIMAAIA